MYLWCEESFRCELKSLACTLHGISQSYQEHCNHIQSLFLKDLKVLNVLQGGLYIKRYCIVQCKAFVFLF